MKKITFAFVLLLAAQVLATPLEDIMQGMGKDLKLIGKQVGNASLNSSTLAAVRDLQALIKQGTDLEPKAVVGAADEAALVADYKKDMTALLTLVQNLEDALVKNDNSQATQIVSQIVDLKKAGHEKFKKD